MFIGVAKEMNLSNSLANFLVQTLKTTPTRMPGIPSERSAQPTSCNTTDEGPVPVWMKHITMWT